jgi:thiol-disulfide isomerase/thioredoxin
LQKRISNPDTLYVVNFWATWCGPCVKELPAFDQLQRTYKNKPLKVLLVSMDFQSKLKTAVIPFVKRNKIMVDVYLASRKNDQELIDAVDKSWSGALPATLVVNTKKHFRQFYEKTFTFDELNKIYQTNK